MAFSEFSKFLRFPPEYYFLIYERRCPVVTKIITLPSNFMRTDQMWVLYGDPKQNVCMGENRPLKLLCGLKEQTFGSKYNVIC